MSFGCYQVGETIGRGASSKVKVATHCLAGAHHPVAFKVISKSYLQGAKDGRLEANALNEIKIMKKLDHPHIVRLYESIQTRRDLVLVMEYFSGGELLDFITSQNKLTEQKARSLFQQVVAAVEHCHLHGVVHRDLKPENLLMSADGRTVKIADFGLSAFLQDGKCLSASCGSPNYSAPEVFRGHLYGAEVDLWSCGVVLYTMVTGRLPFDSDDISELRDQVCNADYELPRFLSSECKDLLRRMLVVDPLKRATISQVKTHPWLAPFFPLYLLRINEDVLARARISEALAASGSNTATAAGAGTASAARPSLGCSADIVGPGRGASTPLAGSPSMMMAQVEEAASPLPAAASQQPSGVLATTPEARIQVGGYVFSTDSSGKLRVVQAAKRETGSTTKLLTGATTAAAHGIGSSSKQQHHHHLQYHAALLSSVDQLVVEMLFYSPANSLEVEADAELIEYLVKRSDWFPLTSSSSSSSSAKQSSSGNSDNILSSDVEAEIKERERIFGELSKHFQEERELRDQPTPKNLEDAAKTGLLPFADPILNFKEHTLWIGYDILAHHRATQNPLISESLDVAANTDPKHKVPLVKSVDKLHSSSIKKDDIGNDENSDRPLPFEPAPSLQSVTQIDTEGTPDTTTRNAAAAPPQPVQQSSPQPVQDNTNIHVDPHLLFPSEAIPISAGTGGESSSTRAARAENNQGGSATAGDSESCRNSTGREMEHPYCLTIGNSIATTHGGGGLGSLPQNFSRGDLSGMHWSPTTPGAPAGPDGAFGIHLPISALPTPQNTSQTGGGGKASPDKYYGTSSALFPGGVPVTSVQPGIGGGGGGIASVVGSATGSSIPAGFGQSAGGGLGSSVSQEHNGLSQPLGASLGMLRTVGDTPKFIANSQTDSQLMALGKAATAAEQQRNKIQKNKRTSVAGGGATGRQRHLRDENADFALYSLHRTRRQSHMSVMAVNGQFGGGVRSPAVLSGFVGGPVDAETNLQVVPPFALQGGKQSASDLNALEIGMSVPEPPKLVGGGGGSLGILGAGAVAEVQPKSVGPGLPEGTGGDGGGGGLGIIGAGASSLAGFAPAATILDRSCSRSMTPQSDAGLQPPQGPSSLLASFTSLDGISLQAAAARSSNEQSTRSNIGEGSANWGRPRSGAATPAAISKEDAETLILPRGVMKLGVLLAEKTEEIQEEEEEDVTISTPPPSALQGSRGPETPPPATTEEKIKKKSKTTTPMEVMEGIYSALIEEGMLWKRGKEIPFSLVCLAPNCQGKLFVSLFRTSVPSAASSTTTEEPCFVIDIRISASHGGLAVLDSAYNLHRRILGKCTREVVVTISKEERTLSSYGQDALDVESDQEEEENTSCGRVANKIMASKKQEDMTPPPSFLHTNNPDSSDVDICDGDDLET